MIGYPPSDYLANYILKHFFKKTNKMAIKLEWKERHVKVALIIASLCFGIGLVTAIPQQDYTLYGTATLTGKVLTAQDDDEGVPIIGVPWYYPVQ